MRQPWPLHLGLLILSLQYKAMSRHLDMSYACLMQQEAGWGVEHSVGKWSCFYFAVAPPSLGKYA